MDECSSERLVRAVASVGFSGCHLADKTVHCRSEPLSSMRRSQYGAIDQLTAAKSRPQRYTVCYPTPKADNFQLRRPTGDKDLCETGARMTGSA